MPPALQAVLMSSVQMLGLQSSIRGARSVTAGPGGIRGSAPHQLNELVARTKPRVWPIPVALFRHHCIITLAIPLAAAAGSSSGGNHFLISFAPAQHGPGDARGLVGHREQHGVGRPEPEVVARREGAKEKPGKASTRRTPSRASVSPGLDRVRTLRR